MMKRLLEKYGTILFSVFCLQFVWQAAATQLLCKMDTLVLRSPCITIVLCALRYLSYSIFLAFLSHGIAMYLDF
jgi:hypothetical protein